MPQCFGQKPQIFQEYLKSGFKSDDSICSVYGTKIGIYYIFNFLVQIIVELLDRNFKIFQVDELVI